MNPGDAHVPAAFDKATLYAIRALLEGTANDGQQKTAIDWIMNEVCRVRDLSYRPGDATATAFAEGRRFAGLQIAKMVSPLALQEAEAAERKAPKQRQRREADRDE